MLDLTRDLFQGPNLRVSDCFAGLLGLKPWHSNADTQPNRLEDMRGLTKVLVSNRDALHTQAQSLTSQACSYATSRSAAPVYCGLAQCDQARQVPKVVCGQHPTGPATTLCRNHLQWLWWILKCRAARETQAAEFCSGTAKRNSNPLLTIKNDVHGIKSTFLEQPGHEFRYPDPVVNPAYYHELRARALSRSQIASDPKHGRHLCLTENPRHR